MRESVVDSECVRFSGALVCILCSHSALKVKIRFLLPFLLSFLLHFGGFSNWCSFGAAFGLRMDDVLSVKIARGKTGSR